MKLPKYAAAIAALILLLSACSSSHKTTGATTPPSTSSTHGSHQVSLAPSNPVPYRWAAPPYSTLTNTSFLTAMLYDGVGLELARALPVINQVCDHVKGGGSSLDAETAFVQAKLLASKYEAAYFVQSAVWHYCGSESERIGVDPYAMDEKQIGNGWERND
jgi:hypothetical protein